MGAPSIYLVYNKSIGFHEYNWTHYHLAGVNQHLPVHLPDNIERKNPSPNLVATTRLTYLVIFIATTYIPALLSYDTHPCT
jgi:hypothetical protein